MAQTETTPGLSVVIPVYNEQENVVALYAEIATALEHTVFEAIFVDDGSIDGTTDNLAMLARQNPGKVRVVVHKTNYGQSAALYSGIRAALYDLVVTMDGDGQNDPADILTLLNQYTPGTAVLGQRRRRNDNLLRIISSRIANGVRRYLLQDGCSDTGCSLKLFARRDFLALPYFNHMHRFLPALFKRAGLQLVLVMVNHRPRQFGTSKYGVLNRIFVGIHDIFGMHWLIKRNCVPEIMRELG